MRVCRILRPAQADQLDPLMTFGPHSSRPQFLSAPQAREPEEHAATADFTGRNDRNRVDEDEDGWGASPSPVRPVKRKVPQAPAYQAEPISLSSDDDHEEVFGF